jgi:hypothetical protein
MLIAVVDTEEQFDWSAPVTRAATSVTAMQSIGRLQSIFDEYGVVPCYVVDYPVATQPDGSDPLREILSAGRCEIGAHLHPWVTPPYEEELSPRNTYPGNLPPQLERAKLDILVRAIENTFAARPAVYKAGRYGVGANTGEIIESLAFEVDVSVCPPIDHRADGGPDYRQFSCEPYWFGTTDRLLEIPLTGAFVGWASGLAPGLYDLTSHPASKSVRLPAVLSRLRAIDRLMLSPEGYTSTEHQRLATTLMRRGVRTFTWSLHSPSVEPGHTPYVQSRKDLARFLDSFRRFFDFFFGDLGGVATTPTQLKSRFEAAV